MEAPYTVASLPRPLDAENGTVCAAPVYGIRGSRKRKRHEVAVGIDGEGVNIYNVQTQNQVNSYALPPQAYLCCPPCSVYCKNAKPVGSHRRTYLVLRDGPHDTKRRLVCLTDGAGEPQISADRAAAPSKRGYSLQDGEILGVEAMVSNNSEPAVHILVIYRDGRTNCISGDLSHSLWEYDARSGGAENEGMEVDYATMADGETAQKGLFASRGDVSALLQSMNGESTPVTEQPLLCKVVRTGRKRSLRLYAVRGLNHARLQSQRSSMQLLMSSDLPSPIKKDHSSRASYYLHTASGKLYELLRGRLTVYDLTGMLPRVAITLGSKAQQVIGFCRLNAASVLAVFADKAMAYDTKYGSTQAAVFLASGQPGAGAGDKRKRAVPEQGVHGWHAISHFSQLGTVIGLSGTELKGVQLMESLRSAKRAKAGGVLLADVMGKGTIIDKAKGEKKARKFDEWKAQVDVAVETQDMAALEDQVARALKLKSIPKTNGDADDLAMAVDGDGDVAVDREDVVADVIDTVNIDRRRVLYILSKIFQVSPGTADAVPSGPRLAATASSENVYIWLAITGLLNAQHVLQALSLYSEVPVLSTTVLPGDIMAALVTTSGNYKLIHDLLALPVHWELEEVVQALQLLVQSFDTPAEGFALKALPDRPLANGDIGVVNGDAESHLKTESAAAERELDMAISALHSGLEVRSAGLRLVLNRLQAFPAKAVTKAMRTMLRHEDIIFFMKILRIELIDGGWTQRYIDVGEDELAEDGIVPGASADGEGSVPSDSALGSISMLMNCAIDAVGISGWLVGQSSDRLGAAELIHGLKVEVSAGLEGLYGLDSLATFLDEMGRCDYSMQQRAHVLDGNGKKSRLQADGEVPLANSLLPMGSRVEPPVVPGRGGRDAKKSRHELAKEKRARVGKYSLDKIRI